MLASFIKILMSIEHLDVNNHPRHFEATLIRLIKKEPVDYDRLQEIIHQYGWNITDTYFCMYMPGTQIDTTIDILTSIVSRFERNYPGSAMIRIASDLLLIMNLTHLKKERDSVLSSIIIDIRECLLQGGVSLQFSNITNLSSYYEQAARAYQLGTKYNPTTWLHRYETYGLQDMLDRITADLLPESFIPYKLKLLMDYDRTHGTPFTKSLKAYIENNMHVSETIKELYLQRATFTYHLKRISEITDLNLNDKNERLYLQIVFKLLEHSQT